MIKSDSIKHLICWAVLTSLMLMTGLTVHASDSGEEYITITVDAEDDSDMVYSIDSMDPDAFTDSNTFTIAAGSSHTIYVKDAAGNITSQEYAPQIYGDDGREQDLTETSIDMEPQDKDQASVPDIGMDADQPDMGSGWSGTGTGTVNDKTRTDGSDAGEKVFYTVGTAEGDTFYMIIDQTQGSDNVYLLDTVTRADLAALAEDRDEGSDAAESSGETDLLAVLQDEADKAPVHGGAERAKESSGVKPQVFVALAVMVGGGAYYYLKIYRAKKDQQMDIMDAMDMEDFLPEEDGDEAGFEIADEERQQFLDDLINWDEMPDTEPDVYDGPPQGIEAASQIADLEIGYDPELDGEEE